MQIVGCFLIFGAQPIALGDKDQPAIRTVQVGPVFVLAKWIDIVTAAQGAMGCIAFDFHLYSLQRLLDGLAHGRMRARLLDIAAGAELSQRAAGSSSDRRRLLLCPYSALLAIKGNDT